MKKTLLTILCAMTALFGMAQSVTYNEQYVVTTNGKAADPKAGEQVVTNIDDFTISFTLKELSISAMGSTIEVGPVTISNIPVQRGSDGLLYFAKEGTYTVPAEKLGSYATLSAQFTDMPVTLTGKLNEDKLYAVLTLKSNGKLMGMMDLIVITEIGTDDFTPAPVEGKVYTEQLLVTINGETPEPQTADVVVVDNGNGTINFVLKNFILVSGESTIPVGNIVVENIPVVKGSDGLDYISYDDGIIIQPGDLEGVEMWYGPMICEQAGAIPLNLQGKMNDEKLYVTIDIDMKNSLGQVVFVQLGTDDFVPAPIQGKVYTEQLLVTINGETPEPQTADVVVVDNGDGTINFVLKNFILVSGESTIPVGNIFVQNLTVTEGEDGLQHISFDGAIIIQPGDMEGVEMWYGPMICEQAGAIPLKLQGMMNNKKLYVTIDIDMKDTLGQVVFVQLGTEFVIKNYTEPYFVKFRSLQTGVTDIRTANVVVTENGEEGDDATIMFTLKDLVLAAGEIAIPIGDQTLHYLKAETNEHGKTLFSGERSIVIPVDKLPEDNQMVQMAKMAGVFDDPLPVTINGWYNDETLYANIQAEAEKMGIDLSFDVQIGFAQGDLNQDGKVDIADAVTVLNIMASDSSNTSADLNNDGKVDIADFVTVLNIMASE